MKHNMKIAMNHKGNNILFAIGDIAFNVSGYEITNECGISKVVLEFYTDTIEVVTIPNEDAEKE